uniref:Kazal-like domain-containing protein n=1 Tax=Setaria italica TaxID=4555 RepID=K3YCR4_SETIT
MPSTGVDSITTSPTEGRCVLDLPPLSSRAAREHTQSHAPIPPSHARLSDSGGGGYGARGPCATADADGDVSLCPVRCFRLDPVCGADGVKYWCGCLEAACAGFGAEL